MECLLLVFFGSGVGVGVSPPMCAVAAAAAASSSCAIRLLIFAWILRRRSARSESLRWTAPVSGEPLKQGKKGREEKQKRAEE